MSNISKRRSESESGSGSESGSESESGSNSFDPFHGELEETPEELDPLDLKLIQAVSKGHINLVRTALRDGADIHAGKEAALREAIDNDNRTIFRLLIKKGADPNAITGFYRPVRISDALADFFGKIAGLDVIRGDLLARKQVNKYLIAYIMEKELRDTDDRCKILYERDSELAKLIKFRKGQPHEEKYLTYFNLQSAIKHHYISSSK